MGMLDSTLTGGEGQKYKECAQRLRLSENDKKWGYLFSSARALCEVLAIKAELGVKTHAVYRNKDKESLKLLISEYDELLRKLEAFYRVYKRQWFQENKPHGFDVQDTRLGGLMMRIRSCMERLQDYYDGKIDRIEELEEKQLDFQGNGEVFRREPICLNSWELTITPNRL